MLDLARLDAGPVERAAFLDEVRRTAYDLGFFYVTGHGVDPDLIDQVLTLSRRFFALPEADKLAIEMVNSPYFRGYNRKGQEYTRGQRDWREMGLYRTMQAVSDLIAVLECSGAMGGTRETA